MVSRLTATFLGTGTSQGIPVIACTCPVCRSTDPKDNRTRTSLMVTGQNVNFVIDTGPDFRQQMLREKVDRLDAVLFTHEHKDHTSGMDDIRAFNYVTRKPMEIYATRNVHASLQREFHYVFSNDKYPGVPEVNLNEIGDDPFQLAGEEIIPLKAMHYKLPVKGFRIRDFAYLTDANFIPEDTYARLKGVRYFVLNALRKEPHVSHFTLSEAIEIAKSVGAELTCFTHISHMMGKHADVAKELPPGTALAFDGLKLQFG